MMDPMITGCLFRGATKKYREGKTLFSEIFTCIKKGEKDKTLDK